MIRIVITGGPSTGKTSLIRGLEDQGITVFHEIARRIIQEQLELNTDNVPWLDVTNFSRLVLKDQIRDFQNAKQNISFYDRGIPDIKAYLNHNNQPQFQELTNAVVKYKYDYIFITPPWLDIYETDNERRESFDDSIQLFHELKNAYIKLGYTPLEIPNVSVASRIEFIKMNING